MMACLSLSTFIPSLDTGMANAALPSLASAFHTSFQAVQWVNLAYLLAMTTLAVVVGRLGDLVGHRRLLLVAVGSYTLGALASGLAQALWFLVLSRALQGFGATTMLTLSAALIAEVAPRARSGEAMGLLGAMHAVGAALGPLLAGALVSVFSWRGIFLLGVPGGVGALVLAFLCLPDDWPAAPSQSLSFGRMPATFFVLGLTAFTLTMVLGQGHPSITNIFCLASACVLLLGFGYSERCAVSPLIPISVRNDRDLMSNVLLLLMATAALMATQVIGPFLLMRSLNLSPLAAGTTLCIGPGIAALGATSIGRMVDRLRASCMIVLGLFALTLGSVALLVLLPMGVMGYALSAALSAMGYVACLTAINASAIAHAGAGQRGLVAGLVKLSRSVGQLTGAVAMGAVFAHFADANPMAVSPVASVTAGVRVTLAVATVLAASTLVLVLARQALSDFRARKPSTT
jgi:MFS family permease